MTRWKMKKISKNGWVITKEITYTCVEELVIAEFREWVNTIKDGDIITMEVEED